MTKAKAIMVQGTMSDTGKSLLTAGLCRIFHQDGYKVAPFKSQNMALNSFITDDGLEISRAQVIQSEAAGVKPSIYMNPILLKPASDMRSQVIVLGEIYKTLDSKGYYECKDNFREKVVEAYNHLADENDIIVIEGAGSPAEINLREGDFVNMGMAEIADAPVLLVGDVDRGGVFAQIVGTLELLTDEEKARVKGTIINKFRGDINILKPGLDFLEEKTQVPVIGVVPYIDHAIEEEDGISARYKTKGETGLIDIAAIRTPHIANFTDFNALEMVEGVTLRYVRDAKDLGDPDMVLIPGSKNTMSDLLWLRERGMEEAILNLAAKGKIIFGICGGYQMLGETLSDPGSVEDGETGGTILGMRLLPIDTEYRDEKIRTRVTGKILKLEGDLEGTKESELQEISEIPITGYEIHMGVTTRRDGAKAFTTIKDKITGEEKIDGCYKDNIFGTYVHGIFDNKGVAEKIAKALARRKGANIKADVSKSYLEFKEEEYDKLADALRRSIDLEKVYEILDIQR